MKFLHLSLKRSTAASSIGFILFTPIIAPAAPLLRPVPRSTQVASTQSDSQSQGTQTQSTPSASGIGNAPQADGTAEALRPAGAAAQTTTATTGSAATTQSSSANQDSSSSQAQTNPQPQTPPPATGTALAPYEKQDGITGSRPAGAAIAAGKQRRTRTLAIRVGLILGAAIAVGVVAAASEGSPARAN